MPSQYRFIQQIFVIILLMSVLAAQSALANNTVGISQFWFNLYLLGAGKGPKPWHVLFEVRNEFGKERARNNFLFWHPIRWRP